MWSNARRELEDVGNGARRVHTERVVTVIPRS